MKKQSLLFGLSLAFILTTATVFAQQNGPKPFTHFTSKWVSTIGYWVVESNINKPKHNIIYLYNNDNVLVYKESKDGEVLNLNQRRTKMRLKKMVEQKVTAYVQKQKETEDQMCVSTLSNK